MSGGLIGFLIGALAIVGAWLFGKVKGSSETKTKISGEVTIEKAKAAKAETEKGLVSDATPLVTKAASGQAKAEAEYSETVRQLETARKSNDMQSVMDIARQLAERMKAKGATE